MHKKRILDKPSRMLIVSTDTEFWSNLIDWLNNCKTIPDTTMLKILDDDSIDYKDLLKESESDVQENGS